MRKKLLAIGAVVLTVGLIAGMVPGIVAADKPLARGVEKPAKVLKGEVIEIDEGEAFFVIQQGEQEPVEVAVDNGTKYFLLPVPKKAIGLAKSEINRWRMEKRQLPNLRNRPGNPLPQQWTNELKKKLRGMGENASFDDIAVGDTVRVIMSRDSEVAEVVFIIKAVEYGQVSGKITAVTSDSITIAGDETVTLTYDGNTRFILEGRIAVEPGQFARAIYNKDKMLAKVVYVQPEGFSQKVQPEG